MKFSLEWFTSLPGLLISCGVLLLIVALIVFIVSSAKSKKEKNPLKNESTANNVVDNKMTAKQAVEKLVEDCNKALNE